MESSEETPFGSFKVKKVLRSTIKSSSSDEADPKGSYQSPWSSKTPEKPINQPRRTRNSRTAFSLKEVRQAALNLRKPGPDPPIQSDLLSFDSQPISASLTETPTAKSRKINPSMKLPEKYEELNKFFVTLDNVIRLLRMKGSSSTFSNISPKIQDLTDRRFSYGNLAQLKYILPDAIEVKKILVHDESTSCMKPDLQITLNVNAIESAGKVKSDGGDLSLRKVFRSRLLNFFKKNPEVDEVPEEILPEPFNRSYQAKNISAVMNPSLSSIGTSSLVPLLGWQIGAVSHLSQSFKRSFSKQVSNHDNLQVNQEPSRVSLQSSELPPSVPLNLPATPVKAIYSEKKEELSSTDNASIQGTPAKLVSTPVRLMSATPAQKTQKRSLMSPNDDSVRSPTKLVRRPSRVRSMKFDTPVKNPVLEDQRLSADDAIFDILSDNLLESIREKEKKVLEEKDPAISEAKWRKQMLASLPKLFDMLLFLFQSINRSVFTKEELVQKIISSHLEIVDKREVDEQLRLLQELVPEWLREKTAASGDLLLCVSKLSCPVSIRTRLAGAK